MTIWPLAIELLMMGKGDQAGQLEQWIIATLNYFAAVAGMAIMCGGK
jgi:hypothetical protein